MATFRIPFFFGAFLICSGCVVGPIYQPTTLRTPDTWNATLTDGGTEVGQNWWADSNDDILFRLIDGARQSNYSLQGVLTNVVAARAILGEASANSYPATTLFASLTRAGEKNDEIPTATTKAVGIGTSWEFDLFGGLRRTREAATARAEARCEDWKAARLALDAEVAKDYVSFRAEQLQQQVYKSSLESYRQTIQLTEINVKAGLTPTAVLSQTRANAETVKIALIASQAQSDLQVKAIVALTGFDELELRKLLQSGPVRLPQFVPLSLTALPAETLMQRPDLASDDDEVIAANAEIGEAEAARYPSLSLTDSVSIESVFSPASAIAESIAGHLVPWALGPTLSVPLLDGGASASAVRLAQAKYELAVSKFREDARKAVREVEETLVNQESARQEEISYQTAVDGYSAYEAAANQRIVAGLESSLALELARRDTLAARINLVKSQAEHAQASIALFKAVGGGWQTDRRIPPGNGGSA